MQYSVTDPSSFLKLLKDNDLFTDFTDEQYKKLIFANSHGFSIEEISTIIWLCSKKYCRHYILSLLCEAHILYLDSIS